MRARPLIHLIAPRWHGWGIHRVAGHRDPPLVLLVLAALVRRYGWDARVIDENHDAIPDDEVPDAVGITVWTPYAPRAYEIAAHYRARGVPVVLGGVHASLLPNEALRHADAVVAGEAEAVIGEVLADLETSTLKRYYHGPWVGMDLVPSVEEYADVYAQFPRGRYLPTQTMQTTRGCRFNCDFCSVIRINGRGSRHMEPERVVEEFRYRLAIPPRLPGGILLFLTDDDLAADRDYAGELMEALASAALPVRWMVQASIGLARDDELVSLAARAGLRALFTGFESVVRDSLVEANKKNRPGEYGELIDRFHRHGISVDGGFIFGFDTDPPDIFEQTVEYIDRIGIDAANFSVLTPYPGTGTYARMYEQGRIVEFDWSRYNYYNAVFEPAQMSRQELQEGMLRAFRLFYGRRRMWRRFRREFGRRELMFSLGYGAVNLTFHHAYTRWREVEYPAPFEADRADLDALLGTSRVEASDAIRVAARTVGDEAGVATGDVPVSLGRVAAMA